MVIRQKVSGRRQLHESRQKTLREGATFGGVHLVFIAATIGLICSWNVLLKAIAAFSVLLREVQRASR